MEIPSIGPKTKLFSHSAAKVDFKSRRDRLVVSHLTPKDKVTISPGAGIPDLRKRLAPPDHVPRLPRIPEGRPPFLPPPGLHPILQPPPSTPPEGGHPRIPVEPPPANPKPIQPHPGIGPPGYVNPSDDFTIPEGLLEAIKQDIADKLSVPVEDITIVDQKQASWSDTSLGNPQPGHYYAQMIVDGYKITVQTGEDKQVSEFYAVWGRIAGPDPFSGQPPGVAVPE